MKEESLKEVIDSQLRKLRATYSEATAELDRERATLTAASNDLEEAVDKYRLRLPAKARVAARAADELLAEGRDEEAQKKLDEQHAAESALIEMETIQQANAARCAEIDAEKRAICRRVFFDSAFDDIRAPLVAHSQILAEAHDYAWQGILDFARDTGTASSRPSLLVAGLKYRLTANDRGPEKALFEKLLEWFGGTANERKLP